MVECTGLENRRRFSPSVGSNPTASATYPFPRIIPISPFFANTCATSTLYGSGSNVALNYAELASISYILDHQNYAELAKQYELNTVDTLVSAGIGAFMGTVFWSNPVDVKYDRAHQRVYEHYKSDFEAGGKFSQEELESQAKLNSAAAVSYARMAHVAPDQVDDMVAKLVWTDDRKAFAVPDEYAMPITQGSEWHMGPSPKRNAEEQIPVLKITEAPLRRKDAIAYTTAILKDGVKNKDSGFVLTASRSDMKKAAGERGGLKERVFTSVAKNIDKIAENSVLVESHVDVKHRNPNVQGVHIFAMPVEFDGSFWRVQLLVKDVIEPGNEKTAVHTIDGIEIHKMENPPVGITQSEGGVSYVAGVAAADNRQVHNVTDNVPNDRTVSLSQLLGGDNPYIRQDGKGFFDSVDDASRAEGGVYYERQDELPQVFYQLGYHGTPYLFDAFTLAHIGSGEDAQTHGWGLYFALSRHTAEDCACPVLLDLRCSIDQTFSQSEKDRGNAPLEASFLGASVLVLW